MPIAVDIDVMLARRKMSVGELAERVGITPANLAVLKNGRARAVRFTTLEALCEVLECQPGDLLRWEPGPPEDGDTVVEAVEAVEAGEARPGAVEVDAVEAGAAG
ncbi:helix-turn-helix domain-containing protein [Streptomyces ossamyceticus]|uniref:helix-turn-helix domain-containing protein n=1 Tax=Streptomyces ossamyceticus TaxID=249581 RepID=UPI0036E8D0A4